jgi:hypothetical protein
MLDLGCGRIGVRHGLYYVVWFVMLRASCSPLLWTRKTGPLLRVKLTTLGSVPWSPEAGPAWA